VVYLPVKPGTIVIPGREDALDSADKLIPGGLRDKRMGRSIAAALAGEYRGSRANEISDNVRDDLEAAEILE